MRRLITISLLPCFLAVGVSSAEPIRPAATNVNSTTSSSLAATGVPSFNAHNAGSHLPAIYIPYESGQPIPCGWRVVRVKFPVRETRIKTVCEEQIVRVPKQVPCMLSKTIRFPTEVYKTYVKFKEITVEDGTLKRHEDAPEADLDDLDLDDLDLGDDEEETVPVSTTTTDSSGGNVPTAVNVHPPRAWPDANPQSQKNRPARPGYEWVPVTKVRKKRVQAQVPVKKIVDVDEGCWNEIVVHIPAHICSNSCPHRAPPSAAANEDGAPTGTMPVIRRVWQSRIVQREVTVTETRDVTIDETYTDYVEQPSIAPDIAPDTGPDTAPDIAPDVMVTTDRIVRIPQYVTKAERHYLTKTVKVPGFKTVFETVKKNVRREVPYEVVRTCERLILVPVDARSIPKSLLAEPHLPGEDVAPSELLPPINRS